MSLVIREGEFVAIMGPSGSGKTTLLAILGCLDRPSSGSYKLVSEEMATLDETPAHTSRRAHRLRVPGLQPAAADERLSQRRAAAGVRGRPSRERRQSRARRASEKSASPIAQPTSPTQLSGGQQQRVAVARALVMQPSVLLLDEPTGNLDSTSEEEVLSLLEHVNRAGATLAMVTHSNEVAERASRIVRLADGAIVSDEHVGGELAVGAG